MDFLKWWWWHVLDEDRREDVLAWLFVFAIIAFMVLLVGIHFWFYPLVFCADLFLGITVSWGWAFWYFSKHHKVYQEKDEEEEES